MRPGASHIIGIDGGGSTCRVAIADASGTVLASATGPAANPATSLEGAIASLRDTVDRAAAQAGLTAGHLHGACAHLGLAGAINRQIAEAVARAMPFAKTLVTDDRPTVMTGALNGADGFVAAIGTGSFLGCQRGHDRRFAGGWGLQLGDQASGAWLGRRALAMVLDWQDGLRGGSGLLAALLQRFQGDTSAIVLFAAKAAPSDFADLAPAVLDAANGSDPAATAILAEATAYLQTALDKLGFHPGDALCLTGGIGARYAAHLGPAYTRNLVEPHGSALDGALRLAADLARAGHAESGSQNDR